MSYKGLNKAQQELLEDEGEDCFELDELPENIVKEFAMLNNHELMYQAANRFLSDRMMEKQHGARKRW